MEQKTEESTAERVESIQNALAKGGGKQLIRYEKAIQLVADDFDIEDPSVMYQKILEENGIQQKKIEKEKQQKQEIPPEKEMQQQKRNKKRILFLNKKHLQMNTKKILKK